MRAVNLLPPDRRETAKSSLTPLARQPIFLAAGVVVLVIALVLGIVTQTAASSVDAKRRQLAQVERQLAAARAPKDRISPSSLATASARRSTILSLAGRRVSWDGFLGSVSLVLPEDVWLVSLTANPAGVAASTTASTATSSTSSTSTTTADTPFAITGYTYSQSSVARLMDRLALVPWLTNIQLKSAALAPVGSRNAFEFTIGASMTNGGGVS